MSGLLSQQEEDEIRAAVKLVTDTFAVTPVAYYSKGTSLDRWKEELESSYNKYELNGLVEWTKAEEDKNQEGAKNFGDIKITFNVEDMIAANVVSNTDFTTIAKSETDYVAVKGNVYELTDVYFDGPLSPKDVLLIFTARKSEKPLNELE